VVVGHLVSDAGEPLVGHGVERAPKRAHMISSASRQPHQPHHRDRHQLERRRHRHRDRPRRRLNARRGATHQQPPAPHPQRHITTSTRANQGAGQIPRPFPMAPGRTTPAPAPPTPTRGSAAFLAASCRRAGAPRSCYLASSAKLDALADRLGQERATDEETQGQRRNEKAPRVQGFPDGRGAEI
jgi:hypothetical protein